MTPPAPKSPSSRSTTTWLLALVALVLVVESVRCVKDVQQQATDDVQWQGTAEALPEPTPAPTLVPKSVLPADFDASINIMAPEALAPTLLQDLDEIASYVEAFPVADYAVHEVAGVGSFYLDDGHDLIKDMLRQGFPWEPEVAALLVKTIRPGSTVLDIGAHIGTHSVTMGRLVGDGGRVYAFEPQRKIYRELVQNMRLNGADNIIPLRYALGSEAGVIEMNPAVAGNEGHTSVGEGGDPVELRTIDSFGFRNVSLVKIDVEGFEDPVLAGCVETIAANRPMLILEIQGDDNFDDAMPAMRAKIVGTIQTIEAMGYRVVRISEFDYMGVPLVPASTPEPAAG